MKPIPTPIRILYVDEGASFGGSLVVAANLATHLDPARFRASVAVPVLDEFTQRIFSPAGRLHRCRNLLSYDRVQPLRSRINDKRPGWWRKILHHLLSVLTVVTSFLYCLRIMLVIVRDRVTIVHVNNCLEGVLAGVLTFRPVLFHLHGDDGSPLPGRHLRLLRRCATFVAISGHARDSAIRTGLPESRIEIVTNGTPVPPLGSTDVAALRSRLGISLDAPLVALVGRVVPWKGHRELVLAAAEVARLHPKAHFMFVGDTSDGNPAFLDELMELARELGLEGKVRCTGYVADVPAHIEASDIVVHTSIESEPFGLVIIEGMAMARPVIASTLGAGPEIVTDGVDGLLADPRQTGELASAICRLIEDPPLARRLSIAGRRTVEQKYSVEAMTRNFERIYERLCDRAPRQSS